MALRRVISRRDQIVDNSGNPLSGGRIDLFAPNTQDRITSYSEADLINENTNPVVLSGSGRANIWISRNADLRITDKDGNLVTEELAINPDDLGGEFDSGLIPNGSFETDTDADDVPDGWVNDVNDPGSNNGLDTTQSTSGGQSWRTQSAGSGGGELATENFFPVNDQDDLRVNFDLRSTVATVRNIVRVEWYDISQVLISNTDVYDSTANPTTFTNQNTLATPPSGARFGKIRIIGGDTGGLGAGITYWDNFRVFYPQVVAGVFDNITIANNDIISTNTNGNINITPNGTGVVALGKNTTVAGTLSATGEASFTASSTVDLSDSAAPLLIGDAAGSHIELDAANIQAKSDATTATEIGVNVLGGNVQIGPLSGTGEVRLNHDGNQVGVTHADGLSVRDGSGATPTLILQSDVPTDIGRVIHSSDNLDLENLVNSGLLRLRGRSSGGAVRDGLTIDFDGDVVLINASIERFKVTSSGTVVVKSDTNTDVESRLIEFRHQNETSRASIGHSGSSTFTIANTIHGGGFAISGENSLGNVRNWITGFPDGTVDVFHAPANEFVLRTQDRSASGTASGCLVRGPEGAMRSVGFNTIPQFTRNTTYTFARGDIGKVMVHDETTARNWDLNDDDTIPVGATWLVHNLNTGNINFISGVGVTLTHLEGGVWNSTTGNLSMAQGAITVYKVTDTEYRLWGVGIL